MRVTLLIISVFYLNFICLNSVQAVVENYQVMEDDLNKACPDSLSHVEIWKHAPERYKIDLKPRLLADMILQYDCPRVQLFAIEGIRITIDEATAKRSAMILLLHDPHFALMLYGSVYEWISKTSASAWASAFYESVTPAVNNKHLVVALYAFPAGTSGKILADPRLPELSVRVLAAVIDRYCDEVTMAGKSVADPKIKQLIDQLRIVPGLPRLISVMNRPASSAHFKQDVISCLNDASLDDMSTAVLLAKQKQYINANLDMSKIVMSESKRRLADELLAEE